MLIVIGNPALNAVEVGLLDNVAMKVFVPMVIFILILSVFKTLLVLLVISLFSLQQAKSWMQIKQAMNVIKVFIRVTEL